jgi:hypothetical protein
MRSTSRDSAPGLGPPSGSLLVICMVQCAVLMSSGGWVTPTRETTSGQSDQDLLGPCTLWGTVFEAPDAPLGGARILARRSADLDLLLFRATTDSEGTFELVVPKGGEYEVQVFSPPPFGPDVPGWSDRPVATGKVVAIASTRSRVVFAAATGLTVVGRVLRDNDRAVVTMVRIEEEGSLPFSWQTTGPSGEFKLYGIRPGIQVLRVLWKESQVSGQLTTVLAHQVEVSTRQESNATVLRSGDGAITGTVLRDSDHVAISGIPVLARSEEKVGSEIPRAESETITDEEGRFRFLRLPEGKYWIAVGCSGFHLPQLPITSAGAPDLGKLLDLGHRLRDTAVETVGPVSPSRAQQSSVVLVVRRSVGASIRVVDHQGRPVSGVFVDLIRRWEVHALFSRECDAHTVQTDESGMARAEGLARGPYLVSVQSYGPAEPTLVDIGEDARTPLEMRLDRMAQVLVEARTQAGKDVPLARVEFVDAHGRVVKGVPALGGLNGVAMKVRFGARLLFGTYEVRGWDQRRRRSGGRVEVENEGRRSVELLFEE